MCKMPGTQQMPKKVSYLLRYGPTLSQDLAKRIEFFSCKASASISSHFFSFGGGMAYEFSGFDWRN